MNNYFFKVFILNLYSGDIRFKFIPRNYYIKRKRIKYIFILFNTYFL